MVGLSYKDAGDNDTYVGLSPDTSRSLPVGILHFKGRGLMLFESKAGEDMELYLAQNGTSRMLNPREVTHIPENSSIEVLALSRRFGIDFPSDLEVRASAKK